MLQDVLGDALDALHDYGLAFLPLVVQFRILSPQDLLERSQCGKLCGFLFDAIDQLRIPVQIPGGQFLRALSVVVRSSGRGTRRGFRDFASWQPLIDGRLCELA